MNAQPNLKRLVVALSGSSGVIYGIRLLEVAQHLPEIETHVVISPAAKRTLLEETSYTVKTVEALADALYDYRDIGAAIASGSFRTHGMIVVPCSIKTMSSLALSLADNLITRAGDVALKEGRPLLVAVRETPLHVGHLRLMTSLAEMGGIIFPPLPAFYNHPRTIEDLIDNTVGRILDRIGITGHGLTSEWRGASSHPTEDTGL